jgi:[ribosomal protein S5]-alanine N-acetyltransferase
MVDAQSESPDLKPFVFPAFETPRLALRPVVGSDIPFLLTLFSREETNYFTAYETIHTMDEARDLYEKYCVCTSGSFRHLIALKPACEPVGTIGLYGYTPERRVVTVGYDLLREHWGKGYMTEAVRGIADYAFKHTSVNRIEGSVDPENVASRQVLVKNGFRLEGVLREKYFYRGQFRDDVVFSVLRKEWAS